jgi:hypothetical protein
VRFLAISAVITAKITSDRLKRREFIFQLLDARVNHFARH